MGGLREKGCFRVRLGVLYVRTYTREGSVTMEWNLGPESRRMGRGALR